MNPWTNPASYQERTIINPRAEENARMVDEMLAILREPAPKPDIRFGEMWPCLVIAFVVGAAMAMVG